MTAMEFEGRTEREAVAKAAAELGSESFDVEVLEKTGGFFGRGKVRIRVRTLSAIPDPMAAGDSSVKKPSRGKKRPSHGGNKGQRNTSAPKAERETEKSAGPHPEPAVPVDPPEKKLVLGIGTFVEGIVERMGYAATVKMLKQDGAKLIYEISSESSSILIGKKGKNLDALQLLANVYLNREAGSDVPYRVVLDTEGYRARREDALVQMAHRVADEAAKSQSSRLLEPMNPFERRLVHTAINERDDVITKSEGDGLYKRVRIMAKGASRSRSGSRPRR